MTEMYTMLIKEHITRCPQLLWWIGVLILRVSPLSAQWVNEWTVITVDKEPAFTLSDSTAVYAVRADDGGYDITKRVWVEKSAVSGEQIEPNTILFDGKGQSMGLTKSHLVLKDLGVPTDRRMARKFVTGLIHGHVLSSAFISNSWPERYLEKWLADKHFGPFWDGFSEYLEKFHFQELSPLPFELKNAGINAWVLRYQDASNQDEQRFRMIIFTRGESNIQCVLTANEVLAIPKLKLLEKTSFGQLHHLSKPNATILTGYEYAAYACIPLTDD